MQAKRISWLHLALGAFLLFLACATPPTRARFIAKRETNNNNEASSDADADATSTTNDPDIVKTATQTSESASEAIVAKNTKLTAFSSAQDATTAQAISSDVGVRDGLDLEPESNNNSTAKAITESSAITESAVKATTASIAIEAITEKATTESTAAAIGSNNNSVTIVSAIEQSTMPTTTTARTPSTTDNGKARVDDYARAMQMETSSSRSDVDVGSEVSSTQSSIAVTPMKLHALPVTSQPPAMTTSRSRLAALVYTTATPTASHENAIDESASTQMRLLPEKRAKFISENSTNAQQLSWPTSSEVWSLAAMKALPKSPTTTTTTTEAVVITTTTLGNDIEWRQQKNLTSQLLSEKNLLDWQQIMMNGALQENRTELMSSTLEATESATLATTTTVTATPAEAAKETIITTTTTEGKTELLTELSNNAIQVETMAATTTTSTTAAPATAELEQLAATPTTTMSPSTTALTTTTTSALNATPAYEMSGHMAMKATENNEKADKSSDANDDVIVSTTTATSATPTATSTATAEPDVSVRITVSTQAAGVASTTDATAAPETTTTANLPSKVEQTATTISTTSTTTTSTTQVTPTATEIGQISNEVNLETITLKAATTTKSDDDLLVAKTKTTTTATAIFTTAEKTNNSTTVASLTELETTTITTPTPKLLAELQAPGKVVENSLETNNIGETLEATADTTKIATTTTVATTVAVTAATTVDPLVAVKVKAVATAQPNEVEEEAATGGQSKDRDSDIESTTTTATREEQQQYDENASAIDAADEEELLSKTTMATMTTERVDSTTTTTTTTTTTEAPHISLLDDSSSSTTTTTTSSPVTTTTAEQISSTLTSSMLPPLESSTSSSGLHLAPTAALPAPTTDMEDNLQQPNSTNAQGETDVNVIIAITVSVIGVVALILLVAFLYLMRKRQKQMSYGQRCRPVNLDAYSLDNVSVLGSVRGRKGRDLRASKRTFTYGNAAFDDPALRHNLLSASELGKFVERRSSIFEEFRDVPQIIARADEVPAGCEDRNRYANVIPLPETRVVLQRQGDDDKTEYINANYVRGPRDAPNYYIACQAPLESTTCDFWRMIWEQQSRVIIQASDLTENGIERCAEYLPPSATLDNHSTYGDYQVTLKHREVKDKYAISTLMLKRTDGEETRELTHYWYKWPETGVPAEEAPIIAMLLEARSSLKSYAIEQANELKEKSSTLTLKSMESSVDADTKKELDSNSSGSGGSNEINGNAAGKGTRNQQGPLTIHCSPGTGRTGTIVACDMAIRCLETPKRSVDIPQLVYYVRRGRASAVQTKEQYEFIYKVANMYATKITNLSNDN